MLLRYWRHEPWGAWRDNLHAAIISREVRRPYLRKGAKNEIDDFMVKDPDTRRRGRIVSMVEMLRGMAGKPTNPQE